MKRLVVLLVAFPHQVVHDLLNVRIRVHIRARQRGYLQIGALKLARTKFVNQACGNLLVPLQILVNLGVMRQNSRIVDFLGGVLAEMCIYLELPGSLVKILDLILMGAYILMDWVDCHLVNFIEGVRTKFCPFVLTNIPILRLLAFVCLLKLNHSLVQGVTLDRVFGHLI